MLGPSRRSLPGRSPGPVKRGSIPTGMDREQQKHRSGRGVPQACFGHSCRTSGGRVAASARWLSNLNQVISITWYIRPIAGRPADRIHTEIRFRRPADCLHSILLPGIRAMLRGREAARLRLRAFDPYIGQAKAPFRGSVPKGIRPRAVRCPSPGPSCRGPESNNREGPRNTGSRFPCARTGFSPLPDSPR